VKRRNPPQKDAAPPSSPTPPRGGALHFRPEAPRRRAAPTRPARGPILVPTRWLKFVTGLLLLPVCWVFSKTFFDDFTRATVAHRFWATEEFYFFALGALLWIIAFFGLPQSRLIMLPYVFGHELTHAIWVWAMGGEVSEFKVTTRGGYIIADRRDFLVSLAPYFFPLYSIAAIAIFAALGLWVGDVWEYRRWLFGAIGATWAFHFSFTCWMIPKQQTDLLLHGTFFSLVVIYLANLGILAALLIIACPQMTWNHFSKELIYNAADLSLWLCQQAGVR
jgi:hypothetical protein